MFLRSGPFRMINSIISLITLVIFLIIILVIKFMPKTEKLCPGKSATCDREIPRNARLSPFYWPFSWSIDKIEGFGSDSLINPQLKRVPDHFKLVN